MAADSGVRLWCEDPHRDFRAGQLQMARMASSANSVRQINTSGSHGSRRLYTSGEPSMRLACSPAAKATATGAAVSHSYMPPSCT
jgi:hypothetical protein